MQDRRGEAEIVRGFQYLLKRVRALAAGSTIGAVVIHLPVRIGRWRSCVAQGHLGQAEIVRKP